MPHDAVEAVAGNRSQTRKDPKTTKMRKLVKMMKMMEVKLIKMKMSIWVWECRVHRVTQQSLKCQAQNPVSTILMRPSPQLSLIKT